ncbi:hypothetical protein DFJ74DRAFT_654425 [Hyaloraphidium curvatum]|nr:hypothetical protein DFJ74DRAFT_654425 [Hyaloraphidium curvatum]
MLLVIAVPYCTQPSCSAAARKIMEERVRAIKKWAAEAGGLKPSAAPRLTVFTELMEWDLSSRILFWQEDCTKEALKLRETGIGGQLKFTQIASSLAFQGTFAQIEKTEINCYACGEPAHFSGKLSRMASLQVPRDEHPAKAAIQIKIWPSCERLECVKACVAASRSYRKEAIERNEVLGVPTHHCQNCRAATRLNMRCSRCHHAHYCSRKCQKAHWPKHKKKCTPPAGNGDGRAEDAGDDDAEVLDDVAGIDLVERHDVILQD